MHSITSTILSGAITVGLGWHLMMPPQGTQVHAPISEWSSIASYVSEKSCRYERKTLLPSTETAEDRRNYARTLQAIKHTRCIYSLDPGLGGGLDPIPDDE